MVLWTNAETFKFIELYQNEPCIWNPTHEQHKDKRNVNNAWLRIENAMGVPVAEIKKKKESLMTAFRLNLKKVIASRKSGEELFKPMWVFYDALANFLSDVYEGRPMLNSEDHSELNSEGDADTTIRTLHKRPNRFINVIRKKSSSHVKKYSSLPKKRTHSDIPISRLSKLRSNDERNDSDRTLEQTDEFQIYGLYVASQLNSLSEKQSLIARERIQSILTQCRLQDLRRRKKTLSSKNATSFHSEDEIEKVQFVLCDKTDKYKSQISSSNLNSAHLDSDTDILEDNFIMHVENIKGEGNVGQDTDSDS